MRLRVSRSQARAGQTLRLGPLRIFRSKTDVKLHSLPDQEPAAPALPDWRYPAPGDFKNGAAYTP
jgi:hypothetical protein